ncbi:MAG: 50S ribosomal protein L14 [Candidatus Micrarchaeota archaeon]
MKGLTAKISKPLTKGSIVVCNDNSGAKELMIIGAIGIRGVRSRYPSVGIGSIIITSVRKGNPDMVKKVVRALIVRQKKEFRRASGLRISFEDNAAVLITEDGLPVGTEIKGVVAREVAERFPKVAAIAPGVI